VTDKGRLKKSEREMESKKVLKSKQKRNGIKAKIASSEK
jgi:hypothetical protein